MVSMAAIYACAPYGRPCQTCSVRWEQLFKRNVSQMGLYSTLTCVLQRGSSTASGAVVIDLSLMRSVYVDPVRQTAVAEGGCLLDDVDSETAVHGLMVPLGHAPVTGASLSCSGIAAKRSHCHHSAGQNSTCPSYL